MATTSRFKQINAFVARQKEAPHAAHLSWMQRFQERVGTLIVTELGQDCPAMIISQNTALVAAVQAEDEAGQYSLEAEAQDGGDVTPVVPE